MYTIRFVTLLPCDRPQRAQQIKRYWAISICETRSYGRLYLRFPPSAERQSSLTQHLASIVSVLRSSYRLGDVASYSPLTRPPVGFVSARSDALRSRLQGLLSKNDNRKQAANEAAARNFRQRRLLEAVILGVSSPPLRDDTDATRAQYVE